ncbi:MAG: hypothetical protein WCO56_29685, partial [Verrucomicrobiota bacterium]
LFKNLQKIRIVKSDRLLGNLQLPALSIAKLQAIGKIIAISVATGAVLSGDRGQKVPYFRYDISPGITSFGPGTDVTSRPDLTWSEAVSITYFRNISVLYMYTILAGPGEVGPHPDGPMVFGKPQFQLRKTILFPDVIQTRVLRKGQD